MSERITLTAAGRRICKISRLPVASMIAWITCSMLPGYHPYMRQGMAWIMCSHIIIPFTVLLVLTTYYLLVTSLSTLWQSLPPTPSMTSPTTSRPTAGASAEIPPTVTSPLGVRG
eukprot:scaffold86666_cov38-Phaeocystis_antarctica.AAC.1